MFTPKHPASMPRAAWVLWGLVLLAVTVSPSSGFAVPSANAAARLRVGGTSPRASSSSSPACDRAARDGKQHQRRVRQQQQSGWRSGWVSTAGTSPSAATHGLVMRGGGGSQDGSRDGNLGRLSMMANPLPETSKAPPSESEPRPQLVYGETTTRSFVKALTWRLTAGVVTLISGLVFSGSLSTAMSIVGSDFVTKSGFMFGGERLWNKMSWGKGEKGDSTKRSLAKAVLWRVFAASNTLICGVFLAKDLSIASKIAGTDTIFKTALFFLNERMWNSIQWGKEFEPEYFI